MASCSSCFTRCVIASGSGIWTASSIRAMRWARPSDIGIQYSEEAGRGRSSHHSHEKHEKENFRVFVVAFVGDRRVSGRGLEIGERSLDAMEKCSLEVDALPEIAQQIGDREAAGLLEQPTHGERTCRVRDLRLIAG